MLCAIRTRKALHRTEVLFLWIYQFTSIKQYYVEYIYVCSLTFNYERVCEQLKQRWKVDDANTVLGGKDVEKYTSTYLHLCTYVYNLGCDVSTLWYWKRSTLDIPTEHFRCRLVKQMKWKLMKVCEYCFKLFQMGCVACIKLYFTLSSTLSIKVFNYYLSMQKVCGVYWKLFNLYYEQIIVCVCVWMWKVCHSICLKVLSTRQQ